MVSDLLSFFSRLRVLNPLHFSSASSELGSVLVLIGRQTNYLTTGKILASIKKFAPNLQLDKRKEKSDDTD